MLQTCSHQHSNFTKTFITCTNAGAVTHSGAAKIARPPLLEISGKNTEFFSKNSVFCSEKYPLFILQETNIHLPDFQNFTRNFFLLPKKSQRISVVYVELIKRF